MDAPTAHAWVSHTEGRPCSVLAPLSVRAPCSHTAGRRGCCCCVPGGQVTARRGRSEPWPGAGPRTRPKAGEGGSGQQCQDPSAAVSLQGRGAGGKWEDPLPKSGPWLMPLSTKVKRQHWARARSGFHTGKGPEARSREHWEASARANPRVPTPHIPSRASQPGDLPLPLNPATLHWGQQKVVRKL